MQDIADLTGARLPPDDLVGRRTNQRPNRKAKGVMAQIKHDGACALQLTELGEHQVQPRLNFLVRVEDDLAASVMRQPPGKRRTKLAPRRFLKLALMQAHANLV